MAGALFAAAVPVGRPAAPGLLLHSVYHRPNGWDHVPPGRKVPCGESSMWGDYHAMELALYLRRLAAGGPYLTFFDPPSALTDAQRSPSITSGRGRHDGSFRSGEATWPR